MNREKCQFCWYLTCILTIRLRDFSITRRLNVKDSSSKQAAVWSPWCDVTIFITLRHDVITTWAKRQLPRASLRLWKKTATNEPRHKISSNVICATSKDSDQPAHTRSLIRDFASRLNFLCVLWYWLNIIWISKLTRRLHRLVWVYTCQMTHCWKSHVAA